MVDYSNENDVVEWSSLKGYIADCPTLESVDLNLKLIDASILEALCRAKKLRQVKLSHYNTRVYCEIESMGLQNASVTTLKSYSNYHVYLLFPNLVKLSICNVKSDDILLMAEHCAHLKDVRLQFLEFIPHATVLLMANAWPTLSKLALHYSGKSITSVISEESLIALISLLPALTWLETSTPEERVSLPTIHYPAGYKGSQLAVLIILCNDAATLEFVTSHCPYLHTLQLYQSERPKEVHIAYTRVETALHHIVNTNITTLWMYEYSRLNDNDLVRLKHANIRYFILFEASYKLTDTSVLALVSTLPQLATLKLEFCNGLSHKVVLAVPRMCPTLRVFEFLQGHGRNDYAPVCHLLFAELLKEKFPHVTTFFVQC